MSAIGMKRFTVASSPACAARITRLYSRSKRSRGDMLLMSGGVPPSPSVSPGAGPVSAAVATGVDGVRETINSRPTSSATRAAPAMIQGVRSARSLVAAEPAARPCPHAGQNFAPAVTAPPQWRQAEAPLGAPQFEQKRPAPEAPQAAQVADEGSLMGAGRTGRSGNVELNANLAQWRRGGLVQRSGEPSGAPRRRAG